MFTYSLRGSEVRLQVRMIPGSEKSLIKIVHVEIRLFDISGARR